MNDLKPFKHGEEGTHSVCNKHNVGDQSTCCECSGKTDCDSSTPTTLEGILKLYNTEHWHKLSMEIREWFKVREIDYGYTDTNIMHFATYIQEKIKTELSSHFTALLEAERDRIEEVKTALLKKARATDYADRTEYDEAVDIIDKFFPPDKKSLIAGKRMGK